MSNAASAEFLQDVEEQAVEECLRLMEAVVDGLQDSGSVYGDGSMNRGERIAFYQQLDAEGALYQLRAINPELLQRMTRQFERDVAAETAQRR